MSRGTKIALAVTLGLLALCCIVAIIFVVVAPRAVSNFADGAVADSPEEVAAVGAGIVDYTVPAGYEEQGGFEAFGTATLFISSEEFDPNSMSFVMMQFPSIMASDPETMRQQMEQSFTQQSGQSGVTLTEVDRQEITIRSQDATLVTLEGTDSSGNDIRQMFVGFEGKGGPAMLMVGGSVDSWDQDAVDEFLSSIRE